MKKKIRNKKINWKLLEIVKQQKKSAKFKSKNILVFSVDIFGLTLLKQS
jgi:hypothetical protein